MKPSEFVPVIEESQRSRGWIANGYAQIEYFLGELIVRSMNMPEYADLGRSLPHDAPRRIKRVRAIAKKDGFFSQFADEIEEIIDLFSEHHEMRNLLAHGFCEFLYTDTHDCGLKFSKWHRQPDRTDARLTKTFRLADLQREEDTITDLSSKAVRLFYKIRHDLGFVDK